MAELRQFERVSFLCRLEVAAVPGGKPLPASSVDISLGGVGLVTQAVFTIGQMVSVTFFLKNAAQQEKREQAVGRVAHFTAEVDGNRAGVQFLNVLNDAECPLLVARLMKQ